MKLQNVQALRALAALSVVGFHLGNPGGLERRFFPPGPVLTAPFGVVGSYGVDLFFAISGFIMVVTTWHEFGSERASLRFILRRLARIYPSYWFALIPVLAIFLLDPALVNAHGGGPPDLFASFLLLPQAKEPLLLVSWSLVFEMEFYVLFTLALLRPRRELPWLACLWLGAVVLLDLALPGNRNAYADFFRSALPLEFVCGMVAGAAVASGRMHAPVVWLVSGLAVCAIAFAVLARPELAGQQWLHAALLGSAAAAIIYGAVGLERLEGWAVPAFVALLGDASYAIYLWHVPVLGALVRVLPHALLGNVAIRVVVLVVLFSAVSAVGIAVYRLVERPLTRALNTRIGALTG